MQQCASLSGELSRQHELAQDGHLDVIRDGRWHGQIAWSLARLYACWPCHGSKGQQQLCIERASDNTVKVLSRTTPMLCVPLATQLLLTTLDHIT